MIEARNLTKRFGSFTAIEDVSFSVSRGEIVGFLGPNGAGKSTTMRILAGVFPPSQGSARVAGHDVVGDSLRARAAIGYFPERVSLYAGMTVAEYLSYVARMKGIARRSEREHIRKAVASCALEPVAGREIGSLSKGYRQRVGVAQAILGSPQVLILDEPTSGLDPEQVAEVRELIRSLRGERTVILSSHILSEIEATCDRVIIIQRGRICAVDTPANLNRRLRPTFQIHVEVNAPAAEAGRQLAALPGILDVRSGEPRDGCATFVVHARPDHDPREEIAAAVIRRGWGLRELRPVSLTLEEIFLTLVGGERRAGGH